MAEPIDRYAEALLDWNRRLNLTGARSRAELVPHLEDAHSLLALPWETIRDAIDIGSGGGLPAIPLALKLPQVRFALLEADRRKAAFLQHVAGMLSLENVEVIPGRAETEGHNPARRERYDRATSRATARPAVLLELALPFVRPGGDLVGEVARVDVGALSRAARELGGGSPYLVPSGTDGRYFLVVPKHARTPAEYPRRPGLPQRRPLVPQPPG